jgi:hypothetical protein
MIPAPNPQTRTRGVNPNVRRSLRVGTGRLSLLLALEVASKHNA